MRNLLRGVRLGGGTKLAVHDRFMYNAVTARFERSYVINMVRGKSLTTY